MSIKAAGGVFGRNPTFNDVTVEGDLSVAGTLSVNGNVLSGLDFEGAWDATSGAPSATPSTGQFWIVSVAGTTNLSGITNWGIGDWALYDGSAWQRIEGGADGNFKQLTSSSTTVLNGTTIPASKTLVVTTDIGSTVEAYDATILKSADIGSTVQGYDADTAKYDDTTANFTGTLQNGGSNVVVDSDIGSTVQAYDATILKSADIGSTVQGYDADTAKLDVAQTWTATQQFTGIVVQNSSGAILNINTNAAGADSKLLLHEGVTSNPQNGSSIYYSGTDNELYICVGTNIDTKRLSISRNTGDISLYKDDGVTVGATWDASAGNLAFASGNGIDFSATAGTGTSELFDDYEEGSYAITATDTGGGATIALKSYTNELTYTKVGQLVNVRGRVQVHSITGSWSGTLSINLPFTSADLTDNADAVGSVLCNYTAFSGSPVCWVHEGSSTLYFYGSQTSAGFGNVQPPVNQYVLFSITYVAA